MKGFSPFTQSKNLSLLNVEKPKVLTRKHNIKPKERRTGKLQSPMKQNLSNLEMYNYYKNKEHITGADKENAVRKEAERLSELPKYAKPVTGTAPILRGGAKLLKAFSKVAKHRGKMNKLLEADLKKRGYTFVNKK